MSRRACSWLTGMDDLARALRDPVLVIPAVVVIVASAIAAYLLWRLL